MPSATVLSTSDVEPSEQCDAWRGWVHSQFHGLESDLYGDTSFDGSVFTTRAGDVIFTRLRAARHQVVRRSSVPRMAEDGHYFKILAPWHGHARVQQAGRNICVGPDAWTIYDTSNEYAVSNPFAVDHLVVMIPKERLCAGGMTLGHVLVSALPGTVGIGRVTLDALRSTYLELPSMSESVACGAGDLVTHLVRLSLLERMGCSMSVTQRETLRARVCAHIARNLGDPGLSVSGIAIAMNCSRRHLYSVFGNEPESLAAYILRQRVEACARELARQQGGRSTLTETALAWGFNNSSHFSRVFRQHTGLSPSDYRAAHTQRQGLPRGSRARP